jgi:hypothetical protein
MNIAVLSQFNILILKIKIRALDNQKGVRQSPILWKLPGTKFLLMGTFYFTSDQQLTYLPIASRNRLDDTTSSMALQSA